MDRTHERRIVKEVYERLRVEYADLPDVYVEAVVRVEYAALTGPVRQFVPILLHRQSTARLQSLRREWNASAPASSGAAHRSA